MRLTSPNKSTPEMETYILRTSSWNLNFGNRKPVLDETLPVVSIITPVFNTVRYLGAAISSIRVQSYPAIEYIIVDGGSTDGTLEIVQANADAVNCWCSAEDDGLYDAINKGITLATGTYIKILNADDILERDAISSLVDALDESTFDCVHGPMTWIDLEGEVLYRKGREDRNFWLPVGFPFFHPTWMVPRAVYEKYGLYNPAFRISGDLDMYYRLITNGVHFRYLDRAVVRFRVGGMSDNLGGIAESNAIHRNHSFVSGSLISFFRRLIWLRNLAVSGIKNFIPD
jgi:glycosyltransferase involved in cell wall biosynthesis